MAKKTVVNETVAATTTETAEKENETMELSEIYNHVCNLHTLLRVRFGELTDDEKAIMAGEDSEDKKNLTMMAEMPVQKILLMAQALYPHVLSLRTSTDREKQRELHCKLFKQSLSALRTIASHEFKINRSAGLTQEEYHNLTQVMFPAVRDCHNFLYEEVSRYIKSREEDRRRNLGNTLLNSVPRRRQTETEQQ